MQANTVDSVRFAKAATKEAVAATQQALVTQPYTPGLSQARENDIRALVQLGDALVKKVRVTAVGLYGLFGARVNVQFSCRVLVGEWVFSVHGKCRVFGSPAVFRSKVHVTSATLVLDF